MSREKLKEHYAEIIRNQLKMQNPEGTVSNIISYWKMNMRNIRNILYTNSLMLVGRGRLS